MSALFERYELKFVISVERKNKSLEAALPGLMKDPHGTNAQYRVSSLYFDSPDLECYYEKLDGIERRRKFRLRYYGEINKDGEDVWNNRTAFLEIKHRIANSVFKERVQLSSEGAQQILKQGDLALLGDCVDPKDKNKSSTINTVIRSAICGHYAPITVISYKREAWMGTSDDRLRVTFDKLCQAYVPENYLEVSRGIGAPLIPGNYVVMEVKFNRAIPRWIRDIILQQRLQVRRFSKYAQGLEALSKVSNLLIPKRA